MYQRLKISDAGPQMIPAGYMYKSIILRADYITNPNVTDVYSAGECGSDVTSPNFCDYGRHFRQNGFGFFNNPQIMHEIALIEQIDLSSMTLLYYEIYQLECDFHDEPELAHDDDLCVESESLALHWVPARYDENFLVDVSLPETKTLVGYDALLAANVIFPDCSMLACCNLDEKFSVNAHCLFDSFETAKSAISSGLFHEKEQYPQRLIAVYNV
jgi:hypothetical protein